MLLESTHIKGVPEPLSGSEVSDDAVELKVIGFPALLNPLVEDWGYAERRVTQRTDSGVEVSCTGGVPKSGEICCWG